MSWSEVFSSDPWNRYLVKNLAKVFVRRLFLRVRFALRLEAWRTLSDSSERVSASEYWYSVDRYWSLYWYLRNQRAALDEGEASLTEDFLEVQKLISASYHAAGKLQRDS